MKKRVATLGSILAEMGRVTPDEVERALRYQRENGGFFGEALIALGLLSPHEVKFALADQYDLPFVNLKLDEIDPAVARMVPGEWARRRGILPVLRDGDGVTVLVAVLPKDDELDALLRYTGARRAELAISAPETIGQLIDAVHGGAGAESTAAEDWIEVAINAGASALGISVRGDRATGWYRADAEGVVQTVLDDRWRFALRQALSPLADAHDNRVYRWPAILTAGTSSWRVDCRVVGSGINCEYVLHLDAMVPAEPSDAEAAPALLEVVERAAGGTLAVGAAAAADGGDDGLVEVLLPALPQVLRGRSARSLHIADHPVAAPVGHLAIRPDEPLADLLESLGSFSLDALTLDVARLDPDELALARLAAPLVVFRRHASSSLRLRSDLDVCLDSGSHPRWNLVS